MKKNLLGALVILFVVFATVLALNELNDTGENEVNKQEYYADMD